MNTLPGDSRPSDRFDRRLTIGFCLVALVLGAFEAWTSRFEMNPTAFNIWTIPRRTARVIFETRSTRSGARCIRGRSREPRRWYVRRANKEYALVHAVNFTLFAASIACFFFS